MARKKDKMRLAGRLASWNDEKGFGFIQPSEDKKRIFVHAQAFVNRSRRPGIDQAVSYAESFDDRGRPCAVNVEFVGDKITKGQPGHKGTWSFAFATFFLTIVATAVITNRIPAVILALYVITSCSAYRAYAKDKSAARSNVWRTPERTLHFLALSGGWPGALIAQQRLRHKSKKRPFRIVFWGTVMLNCAVFFYLYTPGGAENWQALAGHIKVMVKLMAKGLLPAN